jgi:hypothetical protein
MDKLAQGAGCNHKALYYFEKLAEISGIELTNEQRSAICIPNSPAEFACYGWFDCYFNIIGDQEPNKDGEIHLEPTHIIDVHKEYELDMQNCGELDTLSLRPFAELWKRCFPLVICFFFVLVKKQLIFVFSYVKIREYKAVTGKCETCALLSLLRRQFNDKAKREYVTGLFAAHRSAYMGERLEYAKR